MKHVFLGNFAMKTKKRLIALRVLLAVSLLLVFAGCSNPSGGGGGGGQQMATYSGTVNSMTYTLVITQNISKAYNAQVGDLYKLTFADLESTGTVLSFEDDIFELQPDGSVIPFAAAISGSNLSCISGVITWNGEEEGVSNAPGLLNKNGAASQDPSVTVSVQKGSLPAGMAGTVKFDITTENIGEGPTGLISWYTSAAGTKAASSPTGISPSITALNNKNAATITMTATPQSVKGIYYFKVKINTTLSDVATLIVSDAGATLSKSISVGKQKGLLIAGTENSADFKISTENIADFQYCYLHWYSDSEGTIEEVYEPKGVLYESKIIQNNASSITFYTGSATPAGVYYFKVEYEGILSGVATLTVNGPGDPLNKKVTVGEQSGYLIPNAIGSVTFEITADDIENWKMCEVSWFSNPAGTNSINTPPGIATVTSVVMKGAAKLTVNILTTVVSAGKYYFKVTIDNTVSGVATLTVGGGGSTGDGEDNGDGGGDSGDGGGDSGDADYPYLSSSWMGTTIEFNEPVFTKPLSGKLTDWPAPFTEVLPYRADSRVTDYNGRQYAEIADGVITFHCNEPVGGPTDGDFIFVNSGFSSSDGNADSDMIGTARLYYMNWEVRKFNGSDWVLASMDLVHIAFWSEGKIFCIEREFYVWYPQDVKFNNPNIFAGKPGFTLKKGWHSIRSIEKFGTYTITDQSGENPHEVWDGDSVYFSVFPRTASSRNLNWGVGQLIPNMRPEL